MQPLGPRPADRFHPVGGGYEQCLRGDKRVALEGQRYEEVPRPVLLGAGHPVDVAAGDCVGAARGVNPLPAAGAVGAAEAPAAGALHGWPALGIST